MLFLTSTGDEMSTNKTYTSMPDWIRNEERKYSVAFFTFLVELNLFGTDGQSLREFFTLDSDDWTEEDTLYSIDKFLEHGIIKVKE